MATNKSGITVALIPARGGSKGVPGKNIRIIAGKPLIAYAIECGLVSPSVDAVFVSTDSPEIAQVAKQFGALVPFLRPAHLAQDTTPMLPVLEHAIGQIEDFLSVAVDALVLIDPTAPLRTPQDIENALAIFNSSELDAVISGNTAHRSPYFNMVQITPERQVKLVVELDNPVFRRQDAPEVFDLNTVVWVFSRKALMVDKVRIPEKTQLYIVPPERAIDLDTEFDFQMLETQLQRKIPKNES